VYRINSTGAGGLHHKICHTYSGRYCLDESSRRWAQQLTQKVMADSYSDVPGGVWATSQMCYANCAASNYRLRFLPVMVWGEFIHRPACWKCRFFQSTNESIMCAIYSCRNRKGLEKWLELIGWPEVGFIHFFSKNHQESCGSEIAKIWLWQVIHWERRC